MSDNNKNTNINKLKKKEKRKVFFGISLITQVGLSMMVPIAICVAMAVVIQDKMGYDFAVPIAIFIGICTAFRNVFILTRRMYAKDLEKEKRELEYFESLKKERESKQGR